MCWLLPKPIAAPEMLRSSGSHRARRFPTGGFGMSERIAVGDGHVRVVQWALGLVAAGLLASARRALRATPDAIAIPGLSRAASNTR